MNTAKKELFLNWEIVNETSGIIDVLLPSGSKCVILSHSGHQEALREDEAEPGSVPLPGPHVRQP